MSDIVKNAQSKMMREELVRARLRLAMRCLSGAADADARLCARIEWMSAVRNIAKLLGEKADLPFEMVKTELAQAAVSP